MHNNLSVPFVRSYGRIQGRKLSERQRELLEEVLPTISINLADVAFAEWEDIYVEIGFGTGQHLVHIAQQYPHMLCLGAEPFLNGVAQCVGAIAEKQLPNVRLLASDVRPLLMALPPARLARVDILFPDPWPKRVHHKRRIINHELLGLLARTMRPHAPLTIATDHPDYSAWILEQLLLHTSFTWHATHQADFLHAPVDWCITRYQQKAAVQGNLPLFLRSTRHYSNL